MNRVGHRLGELAGSVGRAERRAGTARIALGVAIGLASLGFLIFTLADRWSELTERTDGFDPGWALAGLAVLVAAYGIAAYGWLLILHRLDARPPVSGATGAFRAWSDSLLSRYVPGGVAFVLSRVLLAERTGVPRRVTLLSLGYETGLQVVAATVLGCFFVISHPDLSDQPARYLVLGAIPLGLMMFHPRIFGRLMNSGFSWLGRERLSAVLHARQVGELTAFYVLQWAVYGIGVFFVAKAVAQVSLGDLPEIASAQACALAVAAVTVVVPGGIGVREGAFAWALLPAVDDSLVVAAAIAIAARVVATLAEVVFVGIVSPLTRRTPSP